MKKMDIPEYIKNRIINLTLYTRTSAKKILSIVSTDDIKLTIEDYCEILEEYSKKTGEEITKGNSKEIELKAIEDSLLVELYEEGLRDYQIINYLLDNGYVISPNDLKDRLRVLRENNKLEGRRVTINKKTRSYLGASDFGLARKRSVNGSPFAKFENESWIFLQNSEFCELF